MDTKHPDRIGEESEDASGTNAVDHGGISTTAVLVVVIKDPMAPSSDIILVNEEYAVSGDTPPKPGDKMAVAVGDRALEVVVTHVLPAAGNVRQTIKTRYYDFAGVGFGTKLPKPWRFDQRERTNAAVLLKTGERRF